MAIADPPLIVVGASPIAVSLPETATRQLTEGEWLATFVAVTPTQVISGPLQINVQTDAASGRAVVTVLLLGTQLFCRLLSLTNPTFPLDISLQDCVAKGTFSLQLLAAPDFCSVNAEVLATQSGVDHSVHGSICSWQATAEPIVGDYSTVLTSELTTLTTVRGAQANYAEFGFYLSGTLLAQTVATQFASEQTFTNAIVAGSTRIDPGAKITLSIPTTIAPGWLLLQATFASSTTPPTRISAAIANWTLPQPDCPILQASGVCADDERAVLSSILCKPTV
jgi:hypothetical protein